MPEKHLPAKPLTYLVFVLLAASIIAPPSLALPEARQLNMNNIGRLQPAGPDAIGGIGDWLLSNGTLCAVVSDTEHESGFMAGGGALVDVYDCNEGNDQWAFQHFLPNIDQHAALATESISVSQDQGTASLTVAAKGRGLALESVYTVSDEHPTQLHVSHSLRREEKGDALTMLGLLVLHPHMSLTPFSISTQYPQYGLGFRYPASSTDDMSSLIDAMVPADVHVLVGARNLGEVSYGVQMRRAEVIASDGEISSLPVFQQTGESYNIQGALSSPPWLGGEGKLGLLEFAQSQLMDLAVGERIELEQIIFLGDVADVASVSNQIYTGPTLSGSIDAIDAVIDVFGGDGQPISSVRPNAQGEFKVVLPVRTSSIRLVASEKSMVEAQNYEFSFDGGAIDVGKLTTVKPARLVIENDMALRLTFIGLEETPNPNFYASGFNADFGTGKNPNIQTANYLNFAGTRSDLREVLIAPGRYRVLASRGMEYGVTEKLLELRSGDNLPFVVRPPERELSSDNLLAADFHVHSAPSFDSYIGFDERLRGFVAQGGDVLVATEHNVLIDYTRDLVRAGLKGVVHVLSGIELTGMARTATTPYTHGHLNVFPVSASPEQFAGGLPAHEGKRLRELYASFKDSKSGRLFQLNHPRSIDPNSTDQDTNYFDHLNSGQSYNPQQPLSADEHQSLTEQAPVTLIRDLDFDVLEVANGPYFENYQRVRTDWFSLLNQGERIVATANSDSHGNNYLVAIPQTYVQLANYKERQFMQAVKQGHMFGTTGPLLEVSLRNEQERATMGGTVSGNTVTLEVLARAASWVPIDTVTVFVNGAVATEQAITNGERLSIALQAEADSYVVVEVRGSASELYSVLAPGFESFAFSNPIYIDADSDGEWTAPGLLR